jgi:hypothetical protein
MLQKSFSFIKLFVREVCIMNIFVSRKFDVSIVVKYGEVYYFLRPLEVPLSGLFMVKITLVTK